MINLESLNREELQTLLKRVKLYNSLVKDLWKRWKLEYERLALWKSSYIVEYFSGLNVETVKELSLEVYRLSFGISVKTEEIKFIKKENIYWWIRVFLDDKMVDLSYKKFLNLLKK